LLVRKKTPKNKKIPLVHISTNLPSIHTPLACNTMSPHPVFTEKRLTPLSLFYVIGFGGKADLFLSNSKYNSLLLLYKSSLKLSHGIGKSESIFSENIVLYQEFFLNLQIDVCQSCELLTRKFNATKINLNMGSSYYYK